jgi:hypothetical protein
MKWPESAPTGGIRPSTVFATLPSRAACITSLASVVERIFRDDWFEHRREGLLPELPFASKVRQRLAERYQAVPAPDAGPQLTSMLPFLPACLLYVLLDPSLGIGLALVFPLPQFLQ